MRGGWVGRWEGGLIASLPCSVMNHMRAIADEGSRGGWVGRGAHARVAGLTARSVEVSEGLVVVTTRVEAPRNQASAVAFIGGGNLIVVVE